MVINFTHCILSSLGSRYVTKSYNKCFSTLKRLLSADQSGSWCSRRGESQSKRLYKTVIHTPQAQRSVEKMAASRQAAERQMAEQKFDFFLVLDFEATCDNDNPPKPQEVIEFPVLKVNARTLAVDSTFHEYVRPVHHPKLTPFCTELTGIVQDMVENQSTFPEVFSNFHQWMLSEGLLDPQTQSIFVTCGDWDLKSMLPRQCATSGIAEKPYLQRWINIKKSYADVTRTFPKGMMHMLNGLGLSHLGRHHSGIDDCRNIANIVVKLIKDGYVFRENGRLR